MDRLRPLIRPAYICTMAKITYATRNRPRPYPRIASPYTIFCNQLRMGSNCRYRENEHLFAESSLSRFKAARQMTNNASGPSQWTCRMNRECTQGNPR